MCERKQNITDRSTLRFVEAAQEAFRFLLNCGFKLQNADATILRYASEKVFVNVYHGRSSYELGVEVGRFSSKHCETRGHSLSALMRLKNPRKKEGFKNLVATTPKEVKIGIQKLAKEFISCGDEVLKGDDVVFKTLERQRHDWSLAFAAEVSYRQVSPRAEEAFRQQDYRRAADLYKSIKGKLTPMELKKLEYANAKTRRNKKLKKPK